MFDPDESTAADRSPDPVRVDLDSVERIDDMVRAFYRHVAVDGLLGPVFAHAEVDWASHVPNLCDFWAWQLLGVRGYEGSPLRAHAPAHAHTPFTPELYGRWLELFEATVDAGYAGPVAAAAKQRARRMARAMRRVLDGEHTAGSAAVVPVVGIAGPA
jgi:hemoglobin